MRSYPDQDASSAQPRDEGRGGALSSPGRAGSEKADLQIGVRISRSEDIKLAELLLSARRQGFIYTKGQMVRAAIAMLPDEFGPDLAVRMARVFPEKGR